MWTMFFAIGSILSGVAVGLGAFAAHTLKGRLTPEDAAIFETASKYLTTQSLGIIAFALLMTRIDHSALKLGVFALTLGSLIFSGSLYLLVFTGIRTFGAITPIGGSLLITGWLLGSWSALSTNWQ
jgi:uncharacterized membrane protein YgdD (TMEM256/DUF423 family)